MIPLRMLSKQRVPKEQLHTLIAEIREMQDRPAAIVAATLVEDALEEIITANMTRLSATEYDRLFSGDAPLATFAAKILVARAFKLLDRECAAEITAIKDVRNAFAHARLAIDFDTPPIAEAVNRLKLFEQFKGQTLNIIDKQFYNFLSTITINTARDRFLNSCVFLYFMLLYFPPDPYFLDSEDDT